MKKFLIAGFAAVGLTLAAPALAGPGGCGAGHKSDQTADAPQTPAQIEGQSTPAPSNG